MKELFGILSGMRAIADMGSNYELRKVARTEIRGKIGKTKETK